MYSIISRFTCIFILLFVFTTTKAQDVSHIISYQGQAVASGGIPMEGTHQITVTLYSNRFAADTVWKGVYSVEVEHGIFSIALGSGAYKLPEVSKMNRPLWLGIVVDNEDEMRPLTQLAASPYALNVADNSITFEKLSEELKNSIVLSSSLKPMAADTTVYWSEIGNKGTDPSRNFVGTADNKEFIIKVDSFQAMDYMPSGVLPNIKGGYYGNSIRSELVSATIGGGGGWTDYGGGTHIHSITSSYATIGGGGGNTAGDGADTSYREFQTIGGGVGNNAYGDDATIAGGEYNNATGDESTIGGGSNNSATRNRSGVFSGYHNTADSSGFYRRW